MAEFACRVCGKTYPAYYTGARGHFLRWRGERIAGEDVCADCWECHSHQRSRFFSGQTTRLHEAAAMLSEGHTQAEAAKVAGMSTRTLYNKRKIFSK